MSENERQSQANAVINDKLQGTVVTYLSCGGVVNNQIKKGLLFSLLVKKNFENRLVGYVAELRAKRWIVLCTFFDFKQCGGALLFHL